MFKHFHEQWNSLFLVGDDAFTPAWLMNVSIPEMFARRVRCLKNALYCRSCGGFVLVRVHACLEILLLRPVHLFATFPPTKFRSLDAACVSWNCAEYVMRTYTIIAVENVLFLSRTEARQPFFKYFCQGTSAERKKAALGSCVAAFAAIFFFYARYLLTWIIDLVLANRI